MGEGQSIRLRLQEVLFQLHARRGGDRARLLGGLMPVGNCISHPCHGLARPRPGAPQPDTQLLILGGMVRRLRLLPDAALQSLVSLGGRV